MFISKVNRICERHGRIAILIIGLIIVIPFVFLWGPGSNLFGDKGRGQRVIGRMFGEPLTIADVAVQLQEMELMYYLMRQQPPPKSREFKQYMLDQAFQRLRMLHEARRRGLDKVGVQELQQALVGMFGQNGESGATQYAMFVQYQLPRLGLTEQQLLAMVRHNIVVSRLQREVVSSVYVSPTEVKAAVEKNYTRYDVRQAVFRSADYMDAVSLVPDEQTLEAYYEKHKDELRLPDQKRVRVATVSFEEWIDDATVKDDDVQAYFEEHSETFEGKALDAVRDDIVATLKKRQARTKALEQARTLITRVMALYKEQPTKAAADILKEASDAVGVPTVDSGLFTRQGEIPNIGQKARLSEAAYMVTEEDPFSRIVPEDGVFYLAAWLETMPGEKPTALTAEVRDMLKDQLVLQQVRTFWRERVEPFRVYIENGLTPDEIIEQFASGVLKKGLPDHLAAMNDEDLRNVVTSDVQPFFVPAKKRVRVVAFDPAEYMDDVEPIGVEAVQAYYNQNSGEYAPQVRARHILLRVPDEADADARDDIKARLREVQKKIEAGAEFAELAEEVSEDPGSAQRGGDLGYFTKDRMVEPFSEVAFSLEPGEVSDVIETQFGYHLIKLEAKKPGVSLEEAADSIRKELANKRARELAWEAADAFSYSVYETMTTGEDEEAAEDVPPAQMFAAMAEKKDLAWQDTPWFTENSALAVFESSRSASRNAYALTRHDPLSRVIEGVDKRYVACWLAEQSAELPDLTAAPAYVQAIQTKLRREKARELAREKAEQAYHEIEQGLVAGKEFEAAAEPYPFEAVPEFSLSALPWGTPNARLISDTVPEHSAGTLVEPLRIGDGATLLFLAGVTPPDQETVEEHYDQSEQQLLREKQQNVLESFDAKLQERAKMELDEGVREQLI
ncbi:MAG: peptidylprolyl isomerase [Candidatus Pacebacteria bacterium]|nr:peptidylprolyl isomerase [Candidatus Paceibacterota bacterium]